jgi:excisionase family DNA binding protein
MATEVEETQYITRQQAAKILGVFVRTIDRRIKDGRIKAVKIGELKNSPIRIRKDDFEEYLKSIRIK